MYSVGVVSLGCSKNRVDTELMLGILRKAGYRITADEREADILIVNTCGFIEPAKQESIDTLLSLARYKQEGKLKLLAATGCLTQRYEQAILQDMPEVDLVLGVSQYPMLPRAIEEALAGKRPSYCAPEPTVLCGERVLTTAPYTAYVRIADGCDNRCAYCAIPLIRGGFRSRDMQSVLDEIRALAEQGVKEHVLVAQDTSRFGMDTHGRSLLPELMVRAADIPGVEWLRVLYCYPDEVDDTCLLYTSALARRPTRGLPWAWTGCACCCWACLRCARSSPSPRPRMHAARSPSRRTTWTPRSWRRSSWVCPWPRWAERNTSARSGGRRWIMRPFCPCSPSRPARRNA